MTPIESQGLESSPVPPGTTALTQREILRFYYPLALSWIFMALEAPIAGGIMGRLPEAKLNLAAWYVLFGLALWVESPVIDLLATSTTLSKNRLHYLALTRFTWTLALWVTAIHALLALTPLYGVVMQLMNASPQLAEQGRVAFAIMIPWSALIGWRRYRQGILIRHGHTRLVGIGTAVRVATVAGSGLLFFYFSSLPGTQVAALALICSVGAEALFAHFASRRQVHALLAKSGPEDEPLTTSRLLAFHLPLTATTMVTMAGFPLIAFALNQTRDSVLSLAAWNVAMALLFMMRAITFALTEVVITLDTHHAMQIFHPAALVGPDGRHPEPYTLISVGDVETGRWRLDDAFVESVGLSEAEGREHLSHYVRSLARSGKYDLTVWPYHALLGSVGHALVPSIAEAVFFHGIARGTRSTLVEKGASPLTEHYSVLGPEVLDDARGRPIGRIDEVLVERLVSADAVVVAGQAKSHCVAWTVADLLEQGARRDVGFAGRLFLLEDCTSAVVVPGAIDYTDAAAAAFARFASEGVHVVRSTDPIPGS